MYSMEQMDPKNKLNPIFHHPDIDRLVSIANTMVNIMPFVTWKGYSIYLSFWLFYEYKSFMLNVIE